MNKVGTHMSPNALTRSYLREVIPEYVSLIEQGKRVCFVFGAEKPLVRKNNNDWYVIFEDMVDNAVSPRTQMLNRGWEHDELFYWADTMPELAAKQAHVVKRFLSQLTPGSIDNVHVASCNQPIDQYGRRFVNTYCADVTVNGTRYQLLPDGLHRLIYPDWNPESIVCPKAMTLAYSPRDTWMFSTNANDIGQRYYHSGLVHVRNLVKQSTPEYWSDYKMLPGMPYIGGMSRFNNKYYIG
jgi:hypothetical protein